MEIRYGHGGWVRVDHEDWPGALFLRLEPTESGRWRTKDLYWHGEWRHFVGQDLRELDLGGIEEIILTEMEILERSGKVPGPDVYLLASSFGSTFGSGIYGGRHCDHCSAPLRGRSPREPERWSNDWVALSWFAQYDGNEISRPRPRFDDSVSVKPVAGVERLQRPTDGLTDEFLLHVRDAYSQAVAEGLHPARELARQVGDGATDRTIHKWVYIARQRGIMPPSGRPGRAARKESE